MDNTIDTKALMPAIFALAGVLLATALNILKDLVLKRKERIIQANKLVLERRMQAYDSLIEIMQEFRYSTGEMSGTEYVQIPLILINYERYSKWYLTFIAINGKISHLIDIELSWKLWYLKNYLAHLEKFIYLENRKPVSENQLKLIGKIVYSDFSKIGNDILNDAGRFYSEDIYKLNFEPATNYDKKHPKFLPPDFAELAVFKQAENLRKISS